MESQKDERNEVDSGSEAKFWKTILKEKTDETADTLSMECYVVVVIFVIFFSRTTSLTRYRCEGGADPTSSGGDGNLQWRTGNVNVRRKTVGT